MKNLILIFGLLLSVNYGNAQAPPECTTMTINGNASTGNIHYMPSDPMCLGWWIRDSIEIYVYDETCSGSLVYYGIITGSNFGTVNKSSFTPILCSVTGLHEYYVVIWYNGTQSYNYIYL